MHDKTWNEVLECNDPNISFKLFMNVFTRYFNTAFPLMVQYEKAIITNKWITKGLIISRKNLRLLLNIKRTTCLSMESLKYIQQYQQIFRRLIKEAKKKEADRYVLSSNNKNNALWKLLNKESGKFQQTSNIIIKSGDKIISNPQIVSDSFNIFFTDIIDYLLAQRNHHCLMLKSKLQIEKRANTMFVAPVSATEMEQVIKSLKNNSSTGYDEVPMSLVKQCLCYFIQPLVHIYNVSFQSGIFSDMMKLAKIKTLFKKGDKYDIQNYRLISILSAFSKILEKLMYNRLLSSLKMN